MKKFLFAVLSVALLNITASAKKVKFAVDMTGVTINTTGVHITGDFQLAAGYSEDWCSDCTPLIKEGSSNIYSIIVNIPAFRKYEYRFLNGDLSYETELVPVKSRVQHDFVDNRWLYVDSLANDTTFIGAIKYGGNAPQNRFLVRFVVDMQKETVNAKGVHVAGDFQSWSTTKNILYHFELAPVNVYEQIAYVTAGTYQYKYYNGNATANAEAVPGACATNGNRSITVSSDTIIKTVCFASCSACNATGIKDYLAASHIGLHPNPASSKCTLSFSNSPGTKSLFISDVLGKVIRSYEAINSDTFVLQTENLKPGLYFVHVLHASQARSTEKLIIE